MKKLVKITTMKKRRIETGYSQSELAGKIGVAVSSVGGYERGENPITFSVAQKIGVELKLPLEKLFKPHKKLKNKFIAR